MSGPGTWMGHKEKGKKFFVRGEYEEALSSYLAALNPALGNCPDQERQILLSNIVACRLKVGGPAQARAAVEDAKKCIAINPSWAKGHVRLASAYVALGGHSNDACNELQIALRRDPGNTLARQMLIRELRRENTSAGSSASSATEDTTGERTSFFDDDNNDNSGANDVASGAGPSYSSSSRPSSPRPPPQNPDYYEPPTRDQQRWDHPASAAAAEAAIDDSITFRDRITFYCSQVAAWYSEQSDDAKVAIKVGIAILALYIAFGGRFGLEGLFGGRQHAGNYGEGNAYDRYRRTSSNSYSNDYGNSYSNGYSQRTSSNSYGDSYGNSYGNSYSNSYGSSSLFGGGIPPLLMVMVGFYICHLNGINPFHAMWILNMMNRLGGGRGGVGMMGMGRGMRYGGRRRRFGFGGPRY